MYIVFLGKLEVTSRKLVSPETVPAGDVEVVPPDEDVVVDTRCEVVVF